MFKKMFFHVFLNIGYKTCLNFFNSHINFFLQLLFFRTKRYGNFPTDFHNWGKSRFFRAIPGFGDRLPLERPVWSKVIALSGDVCLSQQTDDETRRLNESCL